MPPGISWWYHEHTSITFVTVSRVLPACILWGSGPTCHSEWCLNSFCDRVIQQVSLHKICDGVTDNVVTMNFMRGVTTNVTYIKNHDGVTANVAYIIFMAVSQKLLHPRILWLKLQHVRDSSRDTANWYLEEISAAEGNRCQIAHQSLPHLSSQSMSTLHWEPVFMSYTYFAMVPVTAKFPFKTWALSTIRSCLHWY